MRAFANIEVSLMKEVFVRYISHEIRQAKNLLAELNPLLKVLNIYQISSECSTCRYRTLEGDFVGSL